MRVRGVGESGVRFTGCCGVCGNIDMPIHALLKGALKVGAAGPTCPLLPMLRHGQLTLASLERGEHGRGVGGVRGVRLLKGSCGVRGDAHMPIYVLLNQGTLKVGAAGSAGPLLPIPMFKRGGLHRGTLFGHQQRKKQGAGREVTATAIATASL